MLAGGEMAAAGPKEAWGELEDDSIGYNGPSPHDEAIRDGRSGM